MSDRGELTRRGLLGALAALPFVGVAARAMASTAAAKPVEYVSPAIDLNLDTDAGTLDLPFTATEAQARRVSRDLLSAQSNRPPTGCARVYFVDDDLWMEWPDGRHGRVGFSRLRHQGEAPQLRCVRSAA